MVSASFSEIRLVSTSAANATTSPTRIPPAKIRMKLDAAWASEGLATLIEVRTMVKTTIAVASLNVASVSMSVASLEGTLALLKISSTVAESVGEIRAANRNETYTERPAIFQRTSPHTRVEIITPIVARATEGRITARRSLERMWIMASKISGGTINPTNMLEPP